MEAAPGSSRRGDLLAVLSLLAIPSVAFGVAAALGHVAINGDNDIQNFPLRVLAAKDLASGHLPVWDPYLWSGTPLLASFSAGAVYPLTLLFVPLPPLAAWVLTLVALYSLVAVGTFAFFRSCGRSVPASMAAAVSLAFAGFLSSQIGHVDVIEAAAWLPWLLFAVRKLAVSPHRRGLWAALLGIGLGIAVVSGSPNTFVDDIIAVGFYALWLCVSHRDRAAPILGLTLAAGLVAGLLSAILWLPGLAWESQTQRHAASLAFVATGSLPPRLTILSALPWLIGANGNFGTAQFAGPYNLSELNGYIGIFPLMAGCGLLASRFRRHPLRREWLGWYLLIALGLVLAWGGDTPAGRVLYDIPYYGQLRDQSRNLLLVDLGLAGLLASWVDVAILPLRARDQDWGGELGRPIPARLARTEVAWTLLPVIGVAIAWAYLLADPRSLALHLTAGGLTNIGATQVDLSISLVIALFAATAVIGSSRMRPAIRTAVIGAVIALDLLVYGAQQYTFQTGGTLQAVDAANLRGRAPQEEELARLAGTGQRIAFEDPAVLPSLYDLERLGLPDYNIVEGVSSVNGYDTLVGAAYEAATGTHSIAHINLGAIADGTLDQLEVGILVTPGPSLGPPQPGLRTALSKGGWISAGSLGQYALWRPTHNLGAVWTAAGSKAARVTALQEGPQDEWSAAISTSGQTEVIRSVAYAPGWSAELRDASGKVRTVSVIQAGLVQGALVPAGTTHIAWVYNPPRLKAGIALTALGALGAAAMATTEATAVMLTRIRRRRKP